MITRRITKTMCVVIVLLSILSGLQVVSGSGVPLDEFYPYGHEHGDKRAPTNDDGSTPPIPVSSLFPFFNHQHDSLIVNTNGVISFLGTMRTYTPSPFPLVSKRRVIAPFWTDIDTRNGGNVWYRETTNRTLLNRASEDIHELFPKYHDFQAAWMFIATWSEVAFYGAHNDTQRDLTNTFQCVMVTNGRHSFTTFLYNRTEWTTGTASSGNFWGLGGTPAQVGFDAGDGMNFFAVKASRTPSIINVTQMSNIDMPGKFVFRVDSTTIKAGGCNFEGTLTITPRQATMLGGTRLIVSGPCFNQTSTSSLQLADGTSVTCKLFTKNSVSCISPMLYRTGKDIVLLNTVQHSGETFSFVGALSIVNHGLTKLVVRRSPLIWKNSSMVNILWKPNDLKILGNSRLRMEIYNMQKSNTNRIQLQLHSTLTGSNVPRIDSGFFRFQLNFSGKAAIIKVSSIEQGGPYVWSDVFTVDVSRQHSDDICQNWNNEDAIHPDISTSDVSPCPCSLRVANIDISRFSVDPTCRGGNSEQTCTFQQFARVCFKQNSPTDLGYDNQCCYDHSGDLMNQNDFPLHGSGYANRYHYKGDNAINVPFLSNFYHDIVPYQHCCLYQSNENNDSRRRCSSFYNRRPKNSCWNYVPPRPARVSGDPHFVTFDGQKYTFNPVGEFKAISSGNFTLQLRMEQIQERSASSVTSFVAKPYPDSNPIEVRGNSIRGIDVLVNGTMEDLDDSISTIVVVDGATIEKTSESPATVVLNFPEEGISIKAVSGSTSNRTVLNLFIFTSSENHKGNMTGLFGDNDGNTTNDLKTADDTVIDGNASLSSIHYDFGSSWRVPESESLFTYEGGRSFSSYQNTAFQPNLDPLVITEELVETCGNNTDCMYDFHVTGDRTFAEMSSNSSEVFEELSVVIEETIVNTTSPSVTISTSTTSTSATATTITTAPTTTTTTTVSTTATSQAMSGNGIPIEEFYPYGIQNGDSEAPRNDDGSTPFITVSSLFPFFNHQHNRLIVNTNGVISFLGTMSTFTPSPFPLASKKRLIAPFWTDIDTRNGGQVFYRETTNMTLLAKASVDIQELFPKYHDFEAAWMFIATWDNVAFYGASYPARVNRRNTFQCVMVTNGRHSFTTFLYNKIQWTTGTASGGNSWGLGGTPAQVGFDAGDGMNYFAVEASRTSNIINVTQMSNIDRPGKFVFRVDSTTIKAGGCNVEGTLTITPRQATMLGGTRLIVSGPCFNQTSTSSLQLADGTSVTCKPFTKNSVSCISPMLYRTGKDIVTLNTVQHSGETFSFVGGLSIVNHGLTKLVVRRSPLIWKNSSMVNILWKPNDLKILGNSSLRMEIFNMQKSNTNRIQLQLHSTLTGSNVPRIDSGFFGFQLNFSGKAAIIKVSSIEQGGPYVWSDVFTVDVSRQHSDDICQDWDNEDAIHPDISTSDVSPCPCSLRVANIDISRFSVDPTCRDGNSEQTCTFQQFARVCFKQNSPTDLGYDNQCCYDHRGDLMNHNDFPLHGSGYANRYHYKGDNAINVPFLSNFYHDIVPYQHCCLYLSDESNESRRRCSSFYNRRPRNSCWNYVPPRPARVSGDPHFVTFDGQKYTFNPVGEFKAISSGNFTLQLRMEQIQERPASSVTSFVAKPYPDSNPIEVRGNSIRGIDVLVNGTMEDFDDSISTNIIVDGTTIEKISETPPTVVLNFPEEGISIKAVSGSTSNRTVLNLFIFTSSENHKGNMTGLFGDNDGNSTNDLKTADDTVIDGNASLFSIHNEFGSTWRVPESESLFTYEGGRSFSSYQNTGFQPNFNAPTITEELIETCGNNKDCMYDFHVTGDREFAEMSSNSSQVFEEMSDAIEHSEFTTSSSSTATITTSSESTTTSSPEISSTFTTELVTTAPTQANAHKTLTTTTTPTTAPTTTTPTTAPTITTTTAPTSTPTTVPTTTSTAPTTTITTTRTTTPTTAPTTTTTTAPTSTVTTTISTAPTSTTTTVPTTTSTTPTTTTSTASTSRTSTASSSTTTTVPTTTITATQATTTTIPSTATKSTTKSKSSFDSQTSKQDLLTTVTITVAGAVLVIGVIIVVIIVVVTMRRVSKRQRRMEKPTHKDHETISQSSDSADSFNFHIKRPLFRRDWVSTASNLNKTYQEHLPDYMYTDKRNWMNNQA